MRARSLAYLSTGCNACRFLIVPTSVRRLESRARSQLSGQSVEQCVTAASPLSFPAAIFMEERQNR